MRSLPAILLLLACAAHAFAQEPAKDAPKPDAQKKQAEAQKKREEAQEAAKGAREQRRAERLKERHIKQNGGRDVDTDSPEAAALDQLLQADPRYVKKDRSVHLRYTFGQPEEAADFRQQGFDAADRAQGFGRGRGRDRRRAQRTAGKQARTRMELVAGSRGGGVLLHALDLEDEFEVSFTVQVMRKTSRSDLVFFVGKGGARFGSQPVRRSGSSFRALTRKSPILTEPFEKGAVKVTLKAKDGELSVALDGVTVATTNKLRGKLDGAVGLFARDMVVYVYEVEIKGRIDPRKLKLKS